MTLRTAPAAAAKRAPFSVGVACGWFGCGSPFGAITGAGVRRPGARFGTLICAGGCCASTYAGGALGLGSGAGIGGPRVAFTAATGNPTAGSMRVIVEYIQRLSDGS
jgi:hypothetical protein